MSDVNVYDEWDESIEEDSGSNRRRSGKKWGYLLRFNEAPVRVHFSYPEKPYVHPKTGRSHPFRSGRRHFIPGGGKRGKGSFEECGVDYKEPCVVCAYTNPAQFELENVAVDGRLSKLESKTYYGVAGWVEEDYHLVEFYKDENNPEAGTYKQRERCMGRGCEYCQDDEQKVFGNKFYSEISPGQWKHTIHDVNTRIQNSHCQCGGDIYVLRFECPACDVIPVCKDKEGREVLMDVSTFCDCDSDNVSINADTMEAVCGDCGNKWSAVYTNHQSIYQLCRDKQKCVECGNTAVLRPVRVCSTEGCEVKPHGVFDCQLTLRVTGKGKDKRMHVDNYVIQPPDPRLFDVECQGGDDWAPKIVEAHKKPLDLDYLLRPDDPDDQAKRLNKPNPFNAAGRTAGAGRYARYEGEGDGGDTATE